MPPRKRATAAQPIASWNNERDVWESPTQSLLSEHSDVYSETWPTSGSMRNGSVFQRPAWEPPTNDSATSSLLPTPEANLGSNGGSQPPEKRRQGRHSVSLQDVIEHM